MRKRCVQCVLAFILLVIAGGARASETTEEAFYRSQITPMALNIYYEGRGESELGQFMVAYVTLKRAEDDRREWGGKTISGVVYKGCQFSWTCGPKQKTPKGPAWDKAVAVATWVALGFFEPPALLANARYYMNPYASSQKNRCWMATTFRQVGVVGNHYFYSEEPAWLVPLKFGCDLSRYNPTVPTS